MSDSIDRPINGCLTRRQVLQIISLALLGPGAMMAQIRDAEAFWPMIVGRILLGGGARRLATGQITRQVARRSGTGAFAGTVATEAAIWGAYSAFSPSSASAETSSGISSVGAAPSGESSTAPGPELLWPLGTTQILTVEVTNSGSRAVESDIALELVDLAAATRDKFVSMPFAVAGHSTFVASLELLSPTRTGLWRIEGQSRNPVVRVAPSPNFRTIRG